MFKYYIFYMKRDDKKTKRSYNVDEQIQMFNNYGYDFYLMSEVKSLILNITETLYKTTLWKEVFKPQHWKSHFGWVLNQMEEIYNNKFNKDIKKWLYDKFESAYYRKENKEQAYKIIKSTFEYYYDLENEKSEVEIKALSEEYKILIQFFTNKK